MAVTGWTGRVEGGVIRDWAEEWFTPFTYKFKVPSLFVDVGANIGRTSVPIVTNTGAAHSVVAIEPVRSNLNFICQDLFFNAIPLGGAGARYHLVAGAASAAWGEIQIHVPIGRGDNAAISAEAAVKNVGGAAEAERITTFPLDDYLAQLRRHRAIPVGGLKGIKIDTQGHEYYVLKGLNHTLSTVKQLAIYAENDPGLMAAAGVNPSEMYAYMRGHGFKAYCYADVSVTTVDGQEVIAVSGNEEAGDSIHCGDMFWIKV
ncbi:hypothetical protein HYH03_017977 [Edaphochlamys debaryana]|uniref:Methyltransferase FkbM domain-containing protein n=1 Tax=Edaphochlamys debaryana TaxID=47281 RepID=A0A836BND2_9CHLO|nr:hypothetical protein HYH03_017977 [Edaphochlamys debaryana]|eukprot:KAG2483131.1 hypothetical protein HYH03_017977 [Edaphochlamys debaryana]